MSKGKHNISLKKFIIQFTGSTIARSSLLLGAALGAFAGTITLYFLSINKGLLINNSLILIFTISGIFTGIIIDLTINLFIFLRRKF